MRVRRQISTIEAPITHRSSTHRINTMNPTRRTLSLAAVAFLSSVPLGALAQSAATFPVRPVTIVVPTPAGGPSDSAARLVAKSLSATWGQAVVVENKAGAGGAIAAQAVMSAQPDGHTLLWAQASMAGMPFVQKSSPYRALAELAPVSNVVSFGYALFVNKDVPVQNFADLVALGRAQPDKLNFATGTLGEYMVAEHVLKAAGIKAMRVPYKGGAQLMPDLIGGQVQINFGPILSGLQHVKAGKLKMLATALPQRSALLPDVPTFTELGIPAGILPTWNAVFAPAGTPREIREAIAIAIAHALKDPAVRGLLEANGAETVGSTPAQLAAATDTATLAWKAFVRDHDIPQE
jgi:tripartite-type tricarboxylate transporter receptor subunit TctC